MIIAGGLDGVPGISVGGLMPACAPEVSVMRMILGNNDDDYLIVIIIWCRQNFCFVVESGKLQVLRL